MAKRRQPGNKKNMVIKILISILTIISITIVSISIISVKFDVSIPKIVVNFIIDCFNPSDEPNNGETGNNTSQDVDNGGQGNNVSDNEVTDSIVITGGEGNNYGDSNNTTNNNTTNHTTDNSTNNTTNNYIGDSNLLYPPVPSPPQNAPPSEMDNNTAVTDSTDINPSISTTNDSYPVSTDANNTNVIEVPYGESEIYGILTGDYPSQEYSFSPSISGRYHFALSYINDMRNNYTLTVKSENDGTLGTVSYGDGDNGITIDLYANQNYVLVVSTPFNYLVYQIDISYPVVEYVSGTTIDGVFSYDRQLDTYTFIPQYDGLYAFELSTWYKSFDYYLRIEDLYGQLIADGFCCDETVYEKIQAGTSYQLIIEQTDGIGKYSIDIYTPGSGYYILMDTFKDYTNYRRNTIEYNPVFSGQYEFEMINNGGWRNPYQVTIYDEDDFIVRRSNTENADSISCFLNSDCTYYIEIIPKNGSCDYEIPVYIVL